MRTDDTPEFRSENFAALCRERVPEKEYHKILTVECCGRKGNYYDRVNREGSFISSEAYVLWYGHSFECFPVGGASILGL